jgi:actinin alpha
MGYVSAGPALRAPLTPTEPVTHTTLFSPVVNSHVLKSGKEYAIDNLLTDLADGLKFAKFLENISNKSIGKLEKKPRMRIHKVSNCDRCIKFLQDEGIKLVGIGAENVVDGNQTLILGLIWSIICQYMIADISDEELAGKEALLLWCKKKTKGYKGVDPDPGMTNFHTSWQNGMAFCALIHKHRPDLLDISKCSPDTPHENLKLAFEVAEEKLGIPQLLDVEDVADVPKPDERSIITYVVQYYHVFAKANKGEVAGRRVGKLVDLTRQIEEMKSNYTERARKLVGWCDEKIVWLQEPYPEGDEEAISARLAALAAYRNEERPPQGAEKFALEGVFNTLQVKLSSNNRPPFVPDERLSPEEIEELWRKLLEAEREMEAKLRESLVNARQLNVFGARFDDKADRLEGWIDRSETYLAKDETVDSLLAAVSKMEELNAWDKERADMNERVEQVALIANEIATLNPELGKAKQERAAAIRTRFDDLDPKEKAKRADLDAKMKREQEKEELRLAFAKAVKEYINWCRSTNSDLKNDRDFGFTLEEVEAQVPRLDESDGTTTTTSAEKRAVVDDLLKRMAELGVTENKYTPLTADDVAKAAESVEGGIKERRTAFDDALAAERAKEEKRKEFAAAADEFVASVDARKATLAAVEGAPEEAIAALRGEHNDGAAEAERLDKLSLLQEELSQLGVTSNKHTPYNMQALKAKDADLRNFVNNRVGALQEEAELRSDYEARAAALNSWVTSESEELEKREPGNTLEDAQAQLAAFNKYRTGDKSEKSNEKFGIERLLSQIAALLEANSRPAYVPPSGLALDDIAAAWTGLDAVEAKRGEWLREYVARQEELAVLVKRFDSEAGDLEAWVATKQAYTAEEADTDSLYKAQYEVVVYESFVEESAARKPRVGTLGELADRIRTLEYGKADEVTARHAAIEASFTELEAAGAAKQAKLTEGLEHQRQLEDLRVQWATKAKDFVRFSKVSVEAVALTDAGFTLETAEAASAKIASDSAELRAAAEAREAEVNAVGAQLGDDQKASNPHTKLSDADIVAARDALAAALAEREARAAAELSRQQSWDASRKEFAAGADAFIAWLGEQKAAVSAAAKAEDENASSVIEGIFAGNAPGEEKLAALRAQSEAMAADGVIGNDYTGFTLPMLESKLAQYAEYVRFALDSIAEEAAFEERARKAAEEKEAAEKSEREQFEFMERAKKLLNFLDNVSALLVEPVVAESLDEVRKLEDGLTEMRAVIDSRKGEYDALMGIASTGVAETPRSRPDQTSANGAGLIGVVEAHWNRADQQLAKRGEAVASERTKQEGNDALARSFADAATELHDWIGAQKATLTGTSGSLEDQMAQLGTLKASNGEGKPKLEKVQQSADELADAGVRSNPFTQLTSDQLKLEYEQLEDATNAKLATVEQELFGKKNAQVSPEQLAEFKEVFVHFDKDNSNSLEAFELAAVLQALGEDATEEEIQELFNKYAQGEPKLTFDNFINLMVDRVQDSDDAGAILESFSTLAGGNAVITEADMRAVMSTEQVDFLLQQMPKVDGGYDYKAFVENAYGSQ